ncbi:MULTISPECIES: carbohydrate ABC transporter permease [unclassified Paenibacillus]|uniref:carbohydrate ABC transporter permease n=1 Tax=unclassified Paenibacillus TaxID=185978 RepID=UPI002F4204EE
MLKKRKLSKPLLFIFMMMAVALFGIPLLWTIASSFKNEFDILQYPPVWVTETPTTDNYTSVLQRFPFFIWLRNSLIVAVVSTIIVVIFDSLAAYALARLEFRGKKFLFALIVSMLLIPMQIDIIPLFIMFSEFKLADHPIALILPTTANVTGVYLLRQFFMSIPVEIEDAARIDGCNDFRIWLQVILPLSKPVIAAVAIITFVSSWNSFLWPLIATNSEASKTLPVGMAQFMSASAGASGSAPAYGITLAASVMATLPTLLMFVFLQKYFVQGITSSGVKG